MYLSHYKLRKKPFDISPDPQFLWFGEKHREGLAILKYGILANKGVSGAVVEGHTDSYGDAAYNRLVSERRAIAVRDYFADQGIESARLTVFASGRRNPPTRQQHGPGSGQ